MGLFSLLPAYMSTGETWATRIFLLLALICMGPWAALLVYDLLLYIFRSVEYEVPIVGGRARGETRPRAPSLTERPSGHRRRFSLARRPDNSAQTSGKAQPTSPDPRLRSTKEAMDGSASS